MQITGNVSNIRFRNEDNAYTVLVLDTDSGKVSAVGKIPVVRPDMRVRLDGEFANTRYGRTFQFTSSEELRPSDVEGIYKYLASGLINNIGPVLARSIVDTFGEETLSVLDNEPERLREVHGIGKKRVESVVSSVKEQTAVRGIMIWLKRYDLSNGLAAKIYKTYGNKAIDVLEENPYKLADDIKGVGFKKADDVAMRLGIPKDSEFRIHSGMRACLEDMAALGHTYVEVGRLIERAASGSYLGLGVRTVAQALESDAFETVGIIEADKAFLPVYYYAERRIAERLHDIQDHKFEDTSDLVDFRRIMADTGVDYPYQQRQAILQPFRSPVMVMTGGPGTGKTTTTNAIINECEWRRMSVLLAAPTGRAAKRMTEATGRPARTIHRLLEYSRGEFQRNRECPLNADVVIIDEASMIDAQLMKSLMLAIPDTATVIFVGDADQLPSVGAGCVLRDMIASGVVPTVRLTEIFRQAQGSAIITNAHKINRGSMPDLQNYHGKDFYFFQLGEREKVADTIVQHVTKAIPESFKVRPSDIQVLSPMRRVGDPIAASALNVRLQAILNDGGEKVAVRSDVEFRVGDKIMQTRNDYEKEVFNGDIGFIVEKLSGKDDDHAVMAARFDDKTVRYAQNELDEVELAYACTIHKSQGSEYPVVVIPVHESQNVMLNRNLLYTGVTRAKRLCVLLGTTKAIGIAVGRADSDKRNTYLKERLREAFGRDEAESVVKEKGAVRPGPATVLNEPVFREGERWAKVEFMTEGGKRVNYIDRDGKLLLDEQDIDRWLGDGTDPVDGKMEVSFPGGRTFPIDANGDVVLWNENEAVEAEDNPKTI